MWLLPAILSLPLTLVAQQAPTNVTAGLDAQGQVTIFLTGIQVEGELSGAPGARSEITG